MKSRLKPLALSVSLLMGPVVAHAQDAHAHDDPAKDAHAQLEGLDAFIAEGMATWGIPGLAVAVVKDDEVVYLRGHGVLRVGESTPVGPSTLFGIASVSKAFTAAAVGILVDEGRLDWDDPVVKHLPHFALYDPYVTRTVTIRDLLAHRVGVGRMTGNRITWMPNRSQAALIEHIRHLGPEQSFRSGYVYSNVMYMVAGEVVAAVSGMPWGAFVTERILRPLGMDRANTSITLIAPGDDAAWPHQEIEGEVVPIARRNFDNVGASASLNLSVEELAIWMRLHLGTPGEVDGIRLLDPATAREMHRAQNHIPDAGLTGPLSAYGLGFQLGQYEGRRVSQHGGSTDGMNTALWLLPEENLGVAVVTNTHNSFMAAVVQRVVDRFLGIEDRPHDVRLRENYLRSFARAQATRDSIHEARAPGTEPSAPLASFTGRFEDALYGEADVRLEAGQLVLRFWEDETQELTLEHWHYDTFRATWLNPAQREKFVWFSRDENGQVASLHVRWNLRHDVLQVGVYPAFYTRDAVFHRVSAPTAAQQQE
jgi:CubicO group peptidase (beta-lactamase class C family)